MIDRLFGILSDALTNSSLFPAVGKNFAISKGSFYKLINQTDIFDVGIEKIYGA